MSGAESSVRVLLVPLLQKVGLKSPAFADALDLSFDGIYVDTSGQLVLPRGYINHVKRLHPHWFKHRRRTYENPDRFWDMYHPNFVFRRQGNRS